MKKGLILLGLLLATLSCNHAETELAESRITVFHAVNGDDEDTKTVLKEGGQIWWMPDDAIKLFWPETEQGRTGIELVSNIAEASSSTDFICPASFDGQSASTFWAVYPSNAVDAFLGESIVISIPSQQVAQEGTFANHFFPSIAKSIDTNLQFYNVCGGIKFSVVRDDIRSVSFEGKNNEVLAGKVKLAIGNNGYPEVVEILEGATAITLVAPDNGFFKPGKFYYLSVLPANLNNGFSLRYRTSSQEERLERGDTRIIKRSIFGVLSDIDFNNDVDIEAIDLGLSVEWASVNLGATKPEEYGYYYAWGETEYNKTTYSWTSYKWADGSESSLNKYNTSDNKTNLDLADDAAHSLLGEDWRIPTKAELDELRQGCTWIRKTKNGVVGYEGVSKRTGNTIFFPMCGVFRDSAIKEIGQTGIYWSSDLTNKKTKAVSLYMMTNKSPQMGEDERRYGYSIRPVSSSGISLNQTSLSLHIGETALLVATVNLSNDADKTVTWTTSNSSVATVVNGAVTAVSVGSAIITATAGGKSATCNVSVEKEDVIPVTSVTLNKTSLNLKKGQNEVLTATVSPDNATDKSVSWSSSDATVASVNQNGKVTALKSGNVTITAKAGEKTATCSVTITTPVESVSLDRTSVNLVEGQTTTLVATINPNDADEKTIEWTTSNASVAMISNGVVTAIAEGNAVVTAKAGGKSATCSVTVEKSIAVTSVTLNKTSLNLKKGQSETLTATVKPDNATDKSVIWSSGDATIASVDQNGKVTAQKIGNVIITAKAGEKLATCEVVVLANSVVTISGTGSQKYNYLGSENTYSVLLKGSAMVEDGFDLDMYFYYSADYTTLDALRMSGKKVVASPSQQDFQVTVDKLKENTTYYFVACVDLKKNNVVKEKLFGEVKTVTTPEYYLPPYVDFRLPSGVKWGTMNVGASNPTEKGSSYSWGHSGYHDSSDYQSGDVLPLEEDRAHIALGGYWRTPTREEWVELFEYCSCSYSMHHEGGSGLVVSNGGAKIFIPLENYWTATCCSPYQTSQSGGWAAATAYYIYGRSDYYNNYVEKKVVNTSYPITLTCRIRAVYVDR